MAVAGDSPATTKAEEGRPPPRRRATDAAIAEAERLPRRESMRSRWARQESIVWPSSRSNLNLEACPEHPGEDDESDSDASNDDEAQTSDGRCVLALARLALIGIVLGASFGVGVLAERRRYATPRGAAEMPPPSESDPQRLLEIAERVVLACDARRRDEESAAECRDLCEGNMCCVEGVWDSASCRGGDTRVCAVYAGCEALLESTWPRH